MFSCYWNPLNSFFFRQGWKITTITHYWVKEKWIAWVYGGNKLQQTVDTTPKLPWYHFSKWQGNIRSFLLIVAALKFKTFHCHFVSWILHYYIKFMLELFSATPLFENYGWKILKDKIMAIMTNELPAPLALVELNVCICTTLYNKIHCKYY